MRPYEPGDAAELLTAVAETRSELEERLRSYHDFHTTEDARRLIARSRGRWILREAFVGGIFEDTGDAYCGGVGLHPVDWDHGRFEVGYWLRLAARGRGYATEAVRLVSRLAFGCLGAERVEIFVEPENVPSCQVAERAGFVLEGRLRRYLPASDGTLRDVNAYSVVREDWDRLDGGAR